MLDMKYVKDNITFVQLKSTEKGCDVNIAEILKLDTAYKSLLNKVELLRRERKILSANLNNIRPKTVDIKRAREIKSELVKLEPLLKESEKTFLTAFKQIPNIPTDDVPIGKTEDDNIITHEVGEIPKFNFTQKNHWQIGELKRWIDKERATKVSGARFAYLKGDLVKLEWALMRYAIEQITDEEIIKKIIAEKKLNVSCKPFIPVLPPYMIRTELYDAMDRLEPREDRYKIDGEELWLQGSAEHVLGSMHADEIFYEDELPIRYAGFATSFRREAGSYGKDMEGIIRLHQFNKLEMESFAIPEKGLDEHLLMIAIEEYLLQQLQLPYRVVMKCTADIGKPNARGVDMDVWLPGQNKYRETSTADYMTDYQSRRLNTRVRRNDGLLQFVYTNDATALSQRPLIAIMENNQLEDGSVVIPDVLRPYMFGKDII